MCPLFPSPKTSSDPSTDSEGPVELQLPEQWLWDIIDEFIYQFQVFCSWRSKVKSKTDDEITMLGEGGPVSTYDIHMRIELIDI